MVKEKKQSSSSNEEINDEVKKLVLFNDDINSFDYVIETLISVCKHHPEQAEQCASITHLKGKCIIKEGYLKTLRNMYNQLADKGLTTEIV